MDQHADIHPRRRRQSRRGQGAALRAEIVEAAGELLAEANDVSAVSLRAIARRVGITPTSIYLHFDDLGELLRAVSVTRFDEFNAALQEARDAAGPEPADRVRAMLHAYVRFGAEHPGSYAIMFSLGRGEAPGTEPIGAYTFQTLLNEVCAVLDQPADDPAAFRVAVSIWTLLDGLVRLRAARPHFPWPELAGQIDDAADRLLGLGSDPKRKSSGRARPAASAPAPRRPARASATSGSMRPVLRWPEAE